MIANYYLMGTVPTPFIEANQLCGDALSAQGDATGKATLLGQPRVALDDGPGLSEYLKDDLCAPDLERMAPRLWMMSTQSSTNISPLHHQRVKGREIMITEDPRLHLVWIHDRIFVKPLPKYLLSHSFWTKYLIDASSPLGKRRQEVLRAALGYLRTYDNLIRHESDFSIAQREELRLIPPSVSYAQFCAFTSGFDKITDSEVSARYSYGELRLTRLNLYCKIFLHRYHFQQVHGQYGAFFSQYYGPLLFIFGILSLVLSAMQVELAAEQLLAILWNAFWRLSRWVSVLSIVAITAVALALGSLLVRMIIDEWLFALKARWRKRRSKEQQKYP